MFSQFEELKKFIQDEMVLNDTPINNETSLFSTRLVNSRNLMHLVSFIENKWQIKISPMDLILENFDTISRIIAYIERKIAD